MDKEKEYKKVFQFLERYSKGPLTQSYTREYSAGLADKEPAANIHNYILSLKKATPIPYKEKLELLFEFIQEQQNQEKIQKRMSSSLYNVIHSHIKREIKNVEVGAPVQTRRK